MLRVVGRVLSSATIGPAAWRYYQAQVAGGACEYYAGAGEVPGRWVGAGLAGVGLAAGARVGERELEALFGRALHPVTGVRLGRGWRVDGVTGYDLTFSAPKSVSVLWALADEQAREQIRVAQGAAVAAALAYLGEHAGYSRAGTNGTVQVRADGLIVAAFEHRTSRAGDPQLHTHLLVLNKVRCPDRAWRSLDGAEVFANKKAAGAVYQAGLRAELHARLGVTFDQPTSNGQADIAGVPETLLAAWSKRAHEIDREAAAKIAEFEGLLGRDLTTAERARITKTAVLKTRPPKSGEPASSLFTRWAAEAAALGWDATRLASEVARTARQAGWQAHRRPPAPAGRLAGDALTAAGRRRAVFSRADLVVAAAAGLPVSAMTAEQARAAVEARTAEALTRPDAIPLADQTQGNTRRASDRRWATAETLAAEARVLARAGARPAGYGLVPTRLAAAGLARAGLDESQRTAVAAAVGGGHPVTVLAAPAGSGKTTTLGVAAKLWAAAGYQVIGLAPSARAAAELTRATGTPAETIAKWCYQADRADTPAGRLLGGLTSRSVLVVDEASMADTFALDRLTAAAAAAKAKVVLVGDPAQIGVIDGPGGLLATLAATPAAVRLGGAHRFSQRWEAQAAAGLRAGNPAVLAGYARAGRIHPHPDEAAALAAVHTAWAAARAGGADTLMLARSRADVDRLNTLARTAAQADGQISGPDLPIGSTVWQAGDVLRTRRNHRGLPVGAGYVRNGDRFTVLGPAPDGDGLAVQDLSGRGRAVLPAGYVAAHAEHGWASTIDGAQGATADIAILLVRPGLDREHLYVGMSRGRHANHAHLAPAPAAADDDVHRPGPAPAPLDGPAALRILTDALARVGGQQSAHSQLTDASLTPTAEARRPGVDRPAPAAPAISPAALRRQVTRQQPPPGWGGDPYGRPYATPQHTGPDRGLSIGM